MIVVVPVTVGHAHCRPYDPKRHSPESNVSRSRIVVVGAGFAGFEAARTLSRRVRDEAEVVLLNPTDYFLYLPLLPQVAAGILEPRRVAVPLPGSLPRVRLVLGEARHIDLDNRLVRYSGPEGERGELTYDRLVLAVGSVNKLLPIPGVAEFAHGFRGLPEALYLRDHVTRQIELAAAGDPAESAARTTFVVVGAGYTGTEVAAQGKLFTDALIRRQPGWGRKPPRAGCWPTSRPGSCPSWTTGCPAPPTGCCAGAASTCAPAPPSGRPPAGASSWTTGSSWRPGPSSGASAYDRTRWSPMSTCPSSTGGCWSTRGSVSPATRRCSPAATPPPSPT